MTLMPTPRRGGEAGAQLVPTVLLHNCISATAMLNEQQLYFEQLIGERSDALPSSGFLTWTRLAELADDFSLD